jgi:hypothetical protein
MPFGYLFSLLAGINNPSIWVFIPDIQDRNTDISTQIIECFLSEKYYLVFIVI